ncbi:AraC family transcriptional regulator [Mesorhizobium tamadayense]|uniref:AraC family transcriptional regulator n=1 Tax=Mesorhizobium tamadayense TaxID=425306 RepID=A0A3P3FZ37_9HYPH|nr:AraC family transcriptional regulator [Mesorhizobium tamadayense]RRI03845.1 AraC family transcriptional regulator [Mesorhizobium tamadayense]
MRPQFASARASAGITIASRHVEAGTYRLPRAHHHRIMVHASAATRSYCNDAGRYFLRRTGDIDFVPAGEEGGFEAETAFDTMEVRLSSAMLEGVASEIEGGMRTRRFDTRHLLRDERIEYLVRALETDQNAGSPGGALFAESVGVALAVRLLGLDDLVTDRPVRLSDAQIRRVLEYVDAHLSEPLTIDTLSRIANASSSHLRTWFKAATGMTLHRYVLRRRVERARSLILESDLSTSEVAYLTGFAHQSRLAHWMRRETGQTPRSLRRARLGA